MVTSLDRDIAAFEENRNRLEASSMAQWVLIHDATVVGTFDSFEAAADQAVEQFGEGPFLIRQVGSSGVALPASVMYHLV